MRIRIIKISGLCLLFIAVCQFETNASPVLSVYQDAPKISNSNGNSEHTLPTYVSSPELSGIPILLANKNIEIDKPRVKRGLKPGITGLFNRGSKQPQPITQRPRSNSLPSFPAAFPSTSPIGFFNSANKQPFTSRPRSNSLPIILPTSSPVGLLNNGNQRPFSTLPRSNSLTPVVQPITTGFSSTINKQFSRKPLFGMDRTSSSSSQAISPNLLSPAQSATSSRRGSFGLEDQMELLSIKPKTASQLQQIDNWEKRPINSAGLNDNCYYCTSAGLTGRTTDTMVKRTQTMQNRFGSIEDTKDLFKSSYHPNVQSRTFTDSNSMKQYLNDRLQPGTSEGFGVAYYHSTARPLNFPPNNGPLTGHMVGMKAWKNPDGTLGTREVDFQLPPNQRFPPQPNNNWSPPGSGSVHLIDLNPIKPMDEWIPLKRPDNLDQGGTPKRIRFKG